MTSNRMRIALITREYPPETSWGGIGSFYFTFANLLKTAGCDVEVFTQGTKASSTENSNGIIIHRVLPRKWIFGKRCGGDLAGNNYIGIFALSLALEMYRAFTSRHNKLPFDLVEGHEHLGINALINLRHKGSLAVVTRYHTAYHTFVTRGLANWPKSVLVKYLEQRSLSSAQYRISASYFIDKITRQDFSKVSPANAIIPLCSRTTKTTTEPHNIRERLILFVGRMMPVHKNPDMVAEAFIRLADHFPNWRVEFAGSDMPLSSSETMWQKCDRILSKYKGRYRYHGQLSRKAVDALLNRASIVIIPSKFESFGLVAQEAMTAGCVPIVSDETALTEVIGDAGISFKNGSLDDLVLKLQYIMSHEDILIHLSSKCIKRMNEEYSESSLLKMNLDFFESAVNKKGPRTE